LLVLFLCIFKMKHKLCLDVHQPHGLISSCKIHDIVLIMKIKLKVYTTVHKRNVFDLLQMHQVLLYKILPWVRGPTNFFNDYWSCTTNIIQKLIDIFWFLWRWKVKNLVWPSHSITEKTYLWVHFPSLYSRFYEVIIFECTYVIGEGEMHECISMFHLLIRKLITRHTYPPNLKFCT
jgi:hypothetical protein